MTDLELQAECFAEVYARRKAAQEAEKVRRRKPWGHGVRGQDIARAEAQARTARRLAGIRLKPGPRRTGLRANF